ncbi:hypothetical protein L1887_53415 [Cichorium endivia]|nr:hypothetical protein L1887_53415 [Cichorium endivia]
MTLVECKARPQSWRSWCKAQKQPHLVHRSSLHLSSSRRRNEPCFICPRLSDGTNLVSIVSSHLSRLDCLVFCLVSSPLSRLLCLVTCPSRLCHVSPLRPHLLALCLDIAFHLDRINVLQQHAPSR